VRVATVDIGTNTVLLLVAERQHGGDLRVVAERATITRLGEGVDRARRLAPEAVERTCACLEEYARIVKEAGSERVAVVGTSAMRDAAGGESLRARVKEMFGVEARVITGDEEARLTFVGALSGLSVGAGTVGVFDIGGGSTEVVHGSVEANAGHLAYAKSFDVGSVRMTERHVAHDPPQSAEREALARAARSAFAEVPPLPDGALVPTGIAGTMTTLASVSLKMAEYDGARVHGHVMPVTELARVVDLLACVPLAERKRIVGMEPKRADVIVAGGAIALELLAHWGAGAVRISDRGVRWGLALELASRA
jgi:exopolyphosphatase/guanosine-5'-triphosphate,3'-diphosphate pyrophosphatase